MKKIIIPTILIIVIIVIAIVLIKYKNNNTKINNTISTNETLSNIINENKVEDKNMDIIYIKIDNQTLDVELENNSATKELKERLKNGDVIVNANDYGGFEKIGALGFSLPSKDTNITTSAGDIVLYQGNQVSLFYNSNSWSYTKLGRIKNIDNKELKDILGNGSVTIVFTLTK